jgi:hypothetical protein
VAEHLSIQGRYVLIPLDAEGMYMVRAKSPNPHDELHGPFKTHKEAAEFIRAMGREFSDYTEFHIEVWKRTSTPSSWRNT